MCGVVCVKKIAPKSREKTSTTFFMMPFPLIVFPSDHRKAVLAHARFGYYEVSFRMRKVLSSRCRSRGRPCPAARVVLPRGSCTGAHLTYTEGTPHRTIFGAFSDFPFPLSPFASLLFSIFSPPSSFFHPGLLPRAVFAVNQSYPQFVHAETRQDDARCCEARRIANFRPAVNEDAVMVLRKVKCHEWPLSFFYLTSRVCLLFWI